MPRRSGDGLRAQAVEAMVSGLVILRMDDPKVPASFRLIEANPAAHRALGIDLAPWIGRPVAELSSEFVSSGAAELVAAVVLSGEPGEIGELSWGDERIAPAVFTGTVFKVDERTAAVELRNVTERRRVETAIISLVRGALSRVGEGYLEAVVVELADILDVDYVLVGELGGPEDQTVSSLALCAHGVIVPDIAYELEGTPCARVAEARPCSYPSGVQELFPDDPLLGEMAIEGFVGVPLFGSRGQTIGVLVALSCQPIPDASFKEVILLVFAGRTGAEIERRRAEAALVASEQSYRTLVEHSPDVIMRADRNGQPLFVSPQIRDVLGFEAEDLFAKHLSELGLSEKQVNLWETTIRSVAETGKPVETVVEVENLDRKVIVDWRLIPEHDRSGQVSSVLGIARDITEQRETRREYETLFNEMLDGFALHEMEFDEHGKPVDYRFLDVNPAFEQLTGLEGRDVVGRSVREVLPGIEPVWIETYGRVTMTGTPVRFAEYNRDLDRFFEVVAFRPQRGRFACIFQDITERRRAERAEVEQRHLAEALRDTSAVLTSTLDLDEVLDRILTNVDRVIEHDAAGIVFVEDDQIALVRTRHGSDMGLDAAFPSASFELLGEIALSGRSVVIDDLLHHPGWSSEAVVDWARSAAMAPIFLERRVLGFLCLFSAKTGFYVDAHLDRIEGFASHAAIAVRNARLFEAVSHHRRELQQLSAKIVTAQEDERKRIAHELHDEVGQTLTAIGFNATALLNATLPGALRGRAEAIDGLARRTLAQIRELSFELRPSVLDDLGLVAALRWLLDRLGAHVGLALSLDTERLDEGERFDGQIEITLYRVVQESLTNAVRHARAKKVTVGLERLKRSIVATITDDGDGFEVERAMASADAFGLVGMRERAALTGGTLQIDSSPGKGARVTIEIPLAPES